MSELYRAVFFWKIRFALVAILISSGFVYLGLLFWFEVNRILGGFVVVPPGLFLVVGLGMGLAKSEGESAIEKIDGGLLTGRPKVHLQTVRETVWNLLGRIVGIRDYRQVRAMRESILIWNPIYDGIVELFAETVVGDPPRLVTGSDGKPLKSESGAHQVEGGWPCQHYPDDWQARARTLLHGYYQERKIHQISGRPERKRGNFLRLRGYMQACIADPGSLTGAEVGMIRMILASIAAARGLPGSPEHEAFRRRQENELPVFHYGSPDGLTQVLISRLENHPPNFGLEAIEELLAPVTPSEAATLGIVRRKPGQEDEESSEIRCPRCNSLNVVKGARYLNKSDTGWLRCLNCGAVAGARDLDGPTREYFLEAGQQFTPQLENQIRRNLYAPLGELIELGIVASGADFEKIIPQLDSKAEGLKIENLPVDGNEMLEIVKGRLAEDPAKPLAIPSRLLTGTLNAVIVSAIAVAIFVGVVVILILGDFGSSTSPESHGTSVVEIERAVDEFMVRSECVREDAVVEFDLTNEEYARVLHFRAAEGVPGSRIAPRVEYRYVYATGAVVAEGTGEFCF